MRDSTDTCEELDSLAIKSSAETTGRTTFLSEACEAASVLGQHYRPSTISRDDKLERDLAAFFRRPQTFTTGTLTSGVRNRQYFYRLSNPLIQYGPAGKLTGYGAVRFTTVFTLEVTSTPFHSGVVCLNWQYGLSDFNRNARSETSTNIPHVRLDLSTSTMVQLRIPFMNQHDLLAINNVDNDYGTIAINTILPIAAPASSSDVSYRLLLHFEDMEFFIPMPVKSTETAILQSGVEREYESDAFPMSSALSAASRSVSYLAKGVPSLSSIGGPASWALKRAAGALRSFGYSKPQNRDPVVRVFSNSNVAEHNVDAPSGTMMVAPFSENHLAVKPEFAGTDVDEMSLAYVLSQYSQVCVGKMKSTDAAGAVLYGTMVSPSYMWFRAPISAPYGNFAAPLKTPDNTSNSFQPSSLFFFSSMFRQWRGDIEFKFTFSKTKMHGGRVLVSFIPSFGDFTRDNNTVDTAPSISIPRSSGMADTTAYSVIFDLRDDSVFTFKVPFTSEKPYMPFTRGTGSLSMLVLDPLTVTPAITSEIDFLVEARACPNFELAFPLGPRYPVHVTGTPRLQSGVSTATYVGEPSELVVGERVDSVKQLIMMPKLSSQLYNTLGYYKNVFPPWWYQPMQSAETGASAPSSMVRESMGFMGNIAKCYLYARGSQDVHVYNAQSEKSVTLSATYSRIPLNDKSVTFNNAMIYSGTNLPRVITVNHGHFRFPTYGMVPRHYTSSYDKVAWSVYGAADADFDTIDTLGAERVEFPRLFVLADSTDVITTLFISRNAGDDAMLGHYMGPPPLLLFGTTATTYDPDTIDF